MLGYENSQSAIFAAVSLCAPKRNFNVSSDFNITNALKAPIAAHFADKMAEIHLEQKYVCPTPQFQAGGSVSQYAWLSSKSQYKHQVPMVVNKAVRQIMFGLSLPVAQ